MKLEKKKSLIARTLNVGKEKIIFNTSRLDEIKEAMTRQDIRDLLVSGAIVIKESKGRLKKEKRKTRRRAGKIRIKQKLRKSGYIAQTRKARAFLFNLKKQNKITQEGFIKLRKEIRARAFRDLSHLKERVQEGIWQEYKNEEEQNQKQIIRQD